MSDRIHGMLLVKKIIKKIRHCLYDPLSNSPLFATLRGEGWEEPSGNLAIFSSFKVYSPHPQDTTDVKQYSGMLSCELFPNSVVI
jgi:hypothetical protein